jgi:O-methyltransferase involved in polyketide biosynthesis
MEKRTIGNAQISAVFEEIADLLARNASMIEEIVEEKASVKEKALLAKLEAVEGKLLELSPEYRSVDREEVAKIQERYGVDRARALKIAADFGPKIKTPPGPANRLRFFRWWLART